MLVLFQHTKMCFDKFKLTTPLKIADKKYRYSPEFFVSLMCHYKLRVAILSCTGNVDKSIPFIGVPKPLDKWAINS